MRATSQNFANGQLRRRVIGCAGALLSLVVVGVGGVVHVPGAHAADKADNAKLPQHVADLRESILAAARSGNADDLASALDMSGMNPDLGGGASNDPIKTLKALSADGNGREILADMIEVLSMPPATLPFGDDIENNLIYVWPYLAERPLDKLTPAEEVDLYRLVTPDLAKEMREKKRWLWWRLTIGADGTWKVFKK